MANGEPVIGIVVGNDVLRYEPNGDFNNNCAHSNGTNVCGSDNDSGVRQRHGNRHPEKTGWIHHDQDCGEAEVRGNGHKLDRL